MNGKVKLLIGIGIAILAIVILAGSVIGWRNTLVGLDE